MACTVRANIAASKQLLAAMEGTPGYDHCARLRTTALTKELGNISVTAVEAADIITDIRTIPWPQSCMDALAQAVNQSMVRDCNHGRAALQDYTAISAYFTACEWMKILDEHANASEKQQIVHQKGPVLGLQHGSEYTSRVVASLSLIAVEGIEAALNASPSHKHEYYKHTNKLLKKEAMLHLDVPTLQQLPQNPRDLASTHRQLYERVFSEAPVPMPICHIKFGNLATSVPLRSSTQHFVVCLWCRAEICRLIHS